MFFVITCGELTCKNFKLAAGIKRQFADDSAGNKSKTKSTRERIVIQIDAIFLNTSKSKKRNAMLARVQGVPNVVVSRSMLRLAIFRGIGKHGAKNLN